MLAAPGEEKEAYTILVKVCAWLTEGLNTPDLIEAMGCLSNSPDADRIPDKDIRDDLGISSQKDL